MRPFGAPEIVRVPLEELVLQASIRSRELEPGALPFHWEGEAHVNWTLAALALFSFETSAVRALSLSYQRDLI